MAPRFQHPHLEIDGLLGPPGTLPAHFHAADPVDGLTFQCPARIVQEVCLHIWTIGWQELDDLNRDRLEAEPMEMVNLPPCPACGGITQFCLNDIEYGSELPEHHTMKVLREHVATRPAFRKLTTFACSKVDGKHHGRDFSHLPAKDRPPQHEKVNVAKEAKQKHREPPPRVGSGP